MPQPCLVLLLLFSGSIHRSNFYIRYTLLLDVRKLCFHRQRLCLPSPFCLYLPARHVCDAVYLVVFAYVLLYF